ncbi:MAG: HAD family hydrolase [Saprospiraceae bacterium]
MKIENIKVIGFDADDTLWVNEPYFRQGEEQFFNLLAEFMPRQSISRELLEVEIANLRLYGYGVKAFMLSMIETAFKIAGEKLPLSVVSEIMDIGRSQLNQPVILLDGVEEVLKQLYGRYRLVMVTKGDLLDQENKLTKSRLSGFFHHIEIVSEKKPSDYAKLIKHLDIKPSQFVMIGNSLKSDVLPVLELGGYGIHVPFHTTWEHEKVDVIVAEPKFYEAESISEVLKLF